MHASYHLIPVVSIVLAGYFLSFTSMKAGLISKLTHRRIWNTLLLITFLVTALLGLLLTIQINYKLEWTIVKTFLKWHVDFGIGMSFIAVFHLIWHWKFFYNIFSKKKQKDKQAHDSPNNQFSDQSVSGYTILLAGFLSMVIQVLLMREITTVFQGNEILMMWTLGVWMLLNGAGTWIGNRLQVTPSRLLINRIILFYSTLPFVLVLLMNEFRNRIFHPGLLIHPASFFLSIVIILLPVCLLTGATYAILIKNVNKNDKGFVKVYALETLGCMLGGLVTSFLLLYWFSVAQSLLLTGIIVQISICFSEKKKGYLLGAGLFGVLLAITYIFPINNLIKSGLFVNQKTVDTKETYYGNITVTEKSGQYNFYENGSLLFTSQNNVISEEYVHYAMLQRKMPEDVLLVSGGVAGMLDELLKYSGLRSIHYVELNPELVEMAKKYFPVPDDDRVTIIFDDVRKYLRNCTNKFDIAIIALPEPTSLQINRLYTKEFLQLLTKRINHGGVVIYGLNSYGNYLSNVQQNLSALMYNTLQNYFRNVIIIPGERDYYLASDSVLSQAIADLWTNNPVENLYVNSYYIDDYGIRERGEYIRNEIKNSSLMNTDNRPLPVFYHALYYFSHFNIKKEVLLALILIFLLVPLLFMRSFTAGVYLAGFSGAAAELLVVFAFQIMYGFVYSAIGLIIAFFMCGLAMGSILASRIKTQLKHFRFVQISMAVYFLIFPLLILFHYHNVSSLNWLVLALMIILPSSIIGFMYVSATRLTLKNTSDAASGMYAADLLGAALGIVAVSVVFLPFLGISGTCLAIAVMNGLGVFLGIFRNKNTLTS